MATVTKAIEPLNMTTLQIYDEIKRRGYKIQPRPLSKTIGARTYPKQKVVHVNTSRLEGHPGLHKQTMAHELSHIMLGHKRKGNSDANWPTALRQELEAMYLQYYLIGHADTSLVRDLWVASKDLGWAKEKFDTYRAKANQKAGIVAHGIKLHQESPSHKTTKGSTPSKPQVLDLGAADTPHPEATHAIDIAEPEKPHPALEEYKVGDFRNPPKEWKGRFDKIVSHAALGIFDTPKTATKTGKALAFLTKPEATVKTKLDLEYVPTLLDILRAGKFGVTKVTAKEVPILDLDDKSLTAEVVVEAQKGYRGDAKEVRFAQRLKEPGYRFPVRLQGLRLTKNVYTDKKGVRLSRKPRRGWKKVKF